MIVRLIERFASLHLRPRRRKLAVARRGLRRATALAALAASAFASVSRPAFAQDAQVELLKPKARQGYYLGGGPRLMSLVVDDDEIGSLGGLFGFGVAFRFGQKVNEWLGLGLVFSGGGASNEDWSVGGGGLLLEAQIQPWLETDLALRVGIGVAGFSTARVDETQETDDDPSGTVGTMYTLGASYELFPWHRPDNYDSGGLAFSFFVEGQFTPGLGGVTSVGAVLGVEFTWWSGLSRNKLDLPVDAAFTK